MTRDVVVNKDFFPTNTALNYTELILNNYENRTNIYGLV